MIRRCEFVTLLARRRRSGPRPAWGPKAERCIGVAVRRGFLRCAGPRYLPTTRLTTMAAMPARTALAIGDDRMSVIGLDAGACC